jgi:3-oxoacyl-[acyl-carrier-protein] synthase-3
VDLVIVATSSPDDLFGDATSVAHAIGATKAVAFDLTAACSGFLFALVTGSQFLHAGTYQKAVIVGADALTRWVDWDDRNVCILFGDGAGAVVLESSGDAKPGEADGPGILGFELHSDGGGQSKLCLPYAGVSRPIGDGGKQETTTGAYAPITMEGKDVYTFATRQVPAVLKEALANAGMTADDVDHLLLHQANIRIMETVAKRLKIPMSKVLTNLSEHGNTSAGSIPLALNQAVKEGRVKKGDVVACAGFGAGLSWGSAIIRWG